MDNIKDTLKAEIEREFEKLKELEEGTDTYKATVDGITKLIDRLHEIEKSESELDFKFNQAEFDNDMKYQQMKDDKKDRSIKNGLTIAGIVVPAALTVWGTIKSIKFEETGTITTIMGRGFIQKLLPKK